MTRSLSVVEAPPALRSMIAETAAAAGWTVHTEASRPPPDVVLVGAVDAIATLRKDAAIRIIAVVPAGDLAEAVRALQAGANDVLYSSDVTPEVILERLSPGKTTTRKAPWRNAAGIPRESNYEAIAARLKKVTDLKILTNVAAELLEATRSSRFSAIDFARIIEREPTLAAKLLRLANSVLYRGEQEVSTIDAAVVRIGTTGVRNLAIAVSVMDRVPERPGKFSAQRLSEHAVAAAVIAEAIARAAFYREPGKAFLCALLHDLGELLLAHCFPKRFSRILQWARERDLPVPRLEQHVLGMDHGQAARIVLAGWTIPEDIVSQVLYQHCPAWTVDGFPDFDARLWRIIALADNYAKGMGWSTDPADPIERLAADYARDLGMEAADLKQAIGNAAERMQEVQKALLGRASSRTAPVPLPPIALVRAPGGPVGALEAYLRHRGTVRSVASYEEATGAEIVVAEAADLDAAVRRLVEPRRAILVAPAGTPAASMRPFRRAGIGAVSYPVTLAELERRLRAAAKAISGV